VEALFASNTVSGSSGVRMNRNFWMIITACGIMASPAVAGTGGRHVTASFYDAPSRSSFASRHKDWRGHTYAITYKGRTVQAVCRDYGPFVRGREIDVSRDVARRLGFIKRGTAKVHIRRVK
jgi:hypothetical protein